MCIPKLTLKLIFLLTLGLLGVSSLHANESSSSSSDADSSEDNPFSSSAKEESNNFYEFKGILGVGHQSQLYLGNGYGNILALAITFDAEYENWFVESNSRNRVGGALGRFYLGYHLWEKENQRLDLVLGHYTPAIDKKDEDGEEIPELVNLNVRNDDELMGLRYSDINDNTYYSVEAAYDILNDSHDSFIVEGYIGKVAAIKNWDLIYGVGATWYSSKVADYYLGIKNFELTESLSEYSSGPAYTIDFELSAQIPISENWIFEFAFEYSLLSSSIKNSPLVVQDDLATALIGFSYVF